jgi:hypothetical protein
MVGRFHLPNVRGGKMAFLNHRPANLQIIPQALNIAYALGHPIIARCVRGDGDVVTHVSVAECARIFHIDRVNAAER